MDILGVAALGLVAIEWLALGWLSGIGWPSQQHVFWAPRWALRLLVGAFLIALAQIADTSGTIAIVDARYGFDEIWRGEQVDAYYNATGNCAFESNSPSKLHCPEGHTDKRHNGGFNLAFVDGHAKWVKNTTLGMWTRRAGD